MDILFRYINNNALRWSWQKKKATVSAEHVRDSFFPRVFDLQQRKGKPNKTKKKKKKKREKHLILSHCT